jgi:hypothetical protein
MLSGGTFKFQVIKFRFNFHLDLMFSAVALQLRKL